jgi:hypothetical protein
MEFIVFVVFDPGVLYYLCVVSYRCTIAPGCYGVASHSFQCGGRNKGLFSREGSIQLWTYRWSVPTPGGSITVGAGGHW